MSWLINILDLFTDAFNKDTTYEQGMKRYDNYVSTQSIQKDWIKISVPSNRIDVLETDMNIRLENPGRYEDPVQELKRITIYFYPEINGEKRKYQRTLQNVDKTIFLFKMHAKGAVDLYFYDTSYREFYADLGFLNEEITL